MPLMFNEPLATRASATTPRPPAIKELPLETRLVNHVVAVARKFPAAKDAEVVYLAVSADKDTAPLANSYPPNLLHNLIVRARDMPTDPPYKVFADAKLMRPPAIREPGARQPASTPGTVVTSDSPVPSIPPTIAAQHGRYAPYPPMGGAVSDGPLEAPPHGGHGGGGHGSFHPHGGHARPFRTVVRGGPGWWWDVPYTPAIVTRTEACQTWGDPIEMPPQMLTAAKVALNVSGGKPTAVRGPDNAVYLFALENGAPTARACVATA